MKSKKSLIVVSISRIAATAQSEFNLASTGRALVIPTVPTIKDILNGNSGRLIVRVGTVRSARNYEIRLWCPWCRRRPGPITGRRAAAPTSDHAPQ